MTITPRGESFLPKISIDELKSLYQKLATGYAACIQRGFQERIIKSNLEDQKD